MITDLKIADAYLSRILTHPVTPGEAGEADAFERWDPSQPFDSSRHTIELKKQPGKDFVILNLADIQCHDRQAFGRVREFYEETVDKLIRTVKPELITLTGDNAFDSLAHLKLIDFLEQYAIPWAPVMGNADHTGVISEYWLGYRLTRAKHCLYRHGPQDMGNGNYIINITENGQPVHLLFMMDTHHEEEMQPGSYDHLYDSQIAWYEWAVKGMAAQTGHMVKSSCFFHIPVPEFQNAWDEADEKQKAQPFCKMHEANGAPKFNNGFFEKCVDLGSTVNLICGHDHKNCFTLTLRGISLTYAMKTGYGCYWERETNGGTTLTVRSDGSTETEHRYIDPAESQVKFFRLEYYGENLYPTHEGN